ncbi:MAG: hypothetical protein Q9183_004857 [Haloplaca sp. 2 TL-2023]
MEAISYPTSKPVEVESPSASQPVPKETGTPEHAPDETPKEDTPKDSAEDSPKDTHESTDDSTQTPKDTHDNAEDATQAPKDTHENEDDSTEAPKDTHDSTEDSTEAPKDTHESTEDSTEAPKDTHDNEEDSNNASDATSDVPGEFFQAPTTPEEPATSSPAKPSQEDATSEDTEDAPKTPVKPSTDNVVSRGLVYNEASLTSKFDSANTGWLYNWDSAPGGEINGAKEFVPMLWNTSELYHTPNWASDVENAVGAGTKHILAFNEPDLPAQANMNVGQSVDGWMQYIEPLHQKYNGDLKLGSPSVCNGPEEHLGLSYLKKFLDSCGGCHVDFLAIHWYGIATDDGVDHLKEHIAKTQEIADGRPIWLTEFKPDGSDEQQADFLSKVLPWLDDKSNGVERYAYFKADNMVSGDRLTRAGEAYAA